MKGWTVLVCSVALAFTFVVGVTRASADNLPETFELVFDGYCDGMYLQTLTTKVQKSTTGWLVQGFRTGCAGEDIVGVNASRKNLDVNFAIDNTSYFYVIRVDRTWANYFNTGGGAVQINSGTWSLASPALTALQTSLPASTDPQ